MRDAAVRPRGEASSALDGLSGRGGVDDGAILAKAPARVFRRCSRCTTARAARREADGSGVTVSHVVEPTARSIAVERRDIRRPPVGRIVVELAAG